jgi:hypothetical protein
MRFSITALSVSGGLVWGAAILLVGLLNLARPGYGNDFLQMTSSVYPWFHDAHTLRSVIMGTIDGFVDGVIAGAIFGVLYNALAGISHMGTSQRAS